MPEQLVATAPSTNVEITITSIQPTTFMYYESNMNEMRSQFAAHLEDFTWTHVCVFTAPSRHDDRLVYEFEKAVRRLARVTQGPVQYAWVIERGRLGTPHMHAFLANTGHVDNSEVAKAWRSGFVHVRRYEAERGGERYFTKTLFSDEARWDVSKRLDSARRAVQTDPNGATAGRQTAPVRLLRPLAPFPGLLEMEEDDAIHRGGSRASLG